MGRPRVVVIGAGFAGLRCATELSRSPVDVTVVDRNNYHTFQPLLYQVATSGLEASDVAYPARAMFWRKGNVSFLNATVTDVDLMARRVMTAGGDAIDFDYLVVACGARVNFFGVEGAAENAFALYTLRDARRLRDHILTCFERAEVRPEEGLLTFVVVGGGPTGVEVAGALAELVDTALVRDFTDLDATEVRIILVEMGESLLAAFSPTSRTFAFAELRRRRVEVRLSEKVSSVSGSSVTLGSGETVPTRTVVWAAGVQAAPPAGMAGTAAGPDGRLAVDLDLRVCGIERVFAVGDVAAVPSGRGGETCPQLAPVAIQSGIHAARQVRRLVEGRRTEPFSYRDKGIMATIGRRAAVAQLKGGVTVTGTLGWLGWLGLHLVYLIGFRNRVVVLVNWAWRYLAWRSGPRLIIDGEERRQSVEGEGPRHGSAGAPP